MRHRSTVADFSMSILRFLGRFQSVKLEFNTWVEREDFFFNLLRACIQSGFGDDVPAGPSVVCAKLKKKRLWPARMRSDDGAPASSRRLVGIPIRSHSINGRAPVQQCKYGLGVAGKSTVIVVP